MLSLCLAALLTVVARPAADMTAMTAAYENGATTRAVRLAAQLIADPTSTPEALKRAHLVQLFAALKRGDDATVLAELGALRSTANADLGDYGSYIEIGALVGSRDCPAADARVERIADTSAFATAAWGLVGACWLRDKNLARADVAIAKSGKLARNSGQAAETLLARAKLAEATHDKAGAIAIFKEAWSEYPLTVAGKKAREELQRRGARVPELTAEDLVERAAGERMQTRGLARRTYRIALANTKAAPVIRGKARLGLIELDVVDKRYPLALSALNTLLNDAKDISVLAHAHFLRGDVLARRGRIAEALDDFSSACTEQPNEPYARESALSGARLAYASRDLARAKWFAEWLIHAPPAARAGSLITEDGAIGPGHSTAELVDGAHWYAAWIERRNGAPRELIDTLLANIDVRGAMGPAAIYWRLRYALESKDDERAKHFATTLLEIAPTSYYALAAADLSCGPDSQCPLRVAISEAARVEGDAAPPPEAPSRTFVGVVTLYTAGLASEAQRLTRVVPQAALDGPDKLVVAWLYARDGDVRNSAMATRKLATGQLADLRDPLVFALAYPRPHKDIVDRTAESYNLPPELIYAVIREESSFDVRAMSPRAARGLMQMMRPTAQRIAKEMGARGFRAYQLFDPPVSIRYGTHYLASLLDLFDGDVAAVAASYHAGETAVARWRSRLGALSIDEFIEEIPYASTRKYVQKVVASYGMYRLMYGHAGANLLRVERDGPATPL